MQEPSAAQPQDGVKQEQTDAADAQPASESDLRTVSVRVEYELRQPGAGLHFSGSYAHTGNEVCTAFMICTYSSDAEYVQGKAGTENLQPIP